MYCCFYRRYGLAALTSCFCFISLLFYFRDAYFSCVFMAFIGYEQFNDSYFSWIFMTSKDKEGWEFFFPVHEGLTWRPSRRLVQTFLSKVKFPNRLLSSLNFSALNINAAFSLTLLKGEECNFCTAKRLPAHSNSIVPDKIFETSWLCIFSTKKCILLYYFNSYSVNKKHKKLYNLSK